MCCWLANTLWLLRQQILFSPCPLDESQGRAGLRLEPTWSAGVVAVLESLGSSTEPALEPAGIMARWLCRKVLLVRRPVARECLPSWFICCCKTGMCYTPEAGINHVPSSH